MSLVGGVTGVGKAVSEKNDTSDDAAADVCLRLLINPYSITPLASPEALTKRLTFKQTACQIGAACSADRSDRLAESALGRLRDRTQWNIGRHLHPPSQKRKKGGTLHLSYRTPLQ